MLEIYQITDEERDTIFKLHFEGGWPTSALAKKYNISKHNIYSILFRRKCKGWNKINYRKLLERYRDVRKQYDINVEKMIKASIAGKKVVHKKYIQKERQLNGVEKKLKKMIDFIKERKKS